eukprot:GDKI01045856.1.p1 GENE.GDKI01045856.1~~GDKI01045856.1.p1  ORF type:complete len:147 (+),score=10.26 GDKI01045856.1:126-566(+)
MPTHLMSDVAPCTHQHTTHSGLRDECHSSKIIADSESQLLTHAHHQKTLSMYDTMPTTRPHLSTHAREHGHTTTHTDTQDMDRDTHAHTHTRTVNHTPTPFCSLIPGRLTSATPTIPAPSLAKPCTECTIPSRRGPLAEASTFLPS